MKIQKRQEIEFFGTKTGNANSIALGYATETKNFGEVAVGVMNKSTAAKDPNSPKGVCVDSDATLFSVGCGGSGERKNALEVKGDGSVLISGEDGDINVADKIKQALDTDASIELVKSADSDLQYTLMVNNESRGSINIPKDQFLKNVTYDTEAKQLVFTFVTLDEEEHVEKISINDLKDVYTAGDGINIDNNVISADFSSVMTAISDEKTQRETTDNEIKSTLDTKADKTEIPTNVSQLDNDSDFITKDVVSDACDDVIKQAVTIDDNNNINGLFFEGGRKNDISNITDFSIGLGCNNDISGEYNIAIGQDIDVRDTYGIAIGTSITSETTSINIGNDILNKGIYNIILGSNKLDLNEGCVSIGYLARKKNIDTVTYQIGGYSRIAAAQEDKRYNIEETLDIDNDHKKYIYGVGGYNGLTTDNAKSLQEVLDEKADTSAIPTKTSQLTNDSSFATEDYVANNIDNFKYIAILNYNNTISGLFDENGESMQAWFENSKSIIIGFSDNTDLDDVHPHNTVSIGNNVSCKGDSNVYIGNEVEADGDNNVLIGRNITYNGNNSVFIGSMHGSPITDGYIGIGYNIYPNINAIYQIAGHGGNNQYNLEETLTYDNQHKKYIYGIGGYDGTNSDAEGIKSLQEVLAGKADASAYYTKTEIDGKGYLTAHQSLADYAKNTDLDDVKASIGDYLDDTLKMYATHTDIYSIADTKADLVDGKLKADQLPKLDNIAAATTTEDMITKFNALLTDLKAKGYMTADITA